MSSSNDDTVLPSPRRPLSSNGLDGETVLPTTVAAGIHSPGDLIDNRYTVIREIGRGGMGVVYEVEDAVTSIRYAIKRLLPDVASNEQIMRAFVREGTSAERFSATSRYLVTTKSVGRDSVGFYVLMEMVTSPTLRQILKQISAGGLQPGKAIPILASLADALNDMHRSGLIHRDLKPENIFVIESADSVTVQLVDFGLTRNASSHTITVLTGGGSLRYMAPELFGEETATAAADIYAFGVIAYESLTGELPRFGETLTDYVPAAAPELVRLVTACLAGKAEKRPQNGDQLVSQIAALLTKRDQLEKPSPKVGVPEPKRPESQPARPTVVRTTLSFEGVQDGAIVEVDKKTLVKPFVYTVDIETNARKAVSVLIRWQDQVVFEKPITLVAGASQSIKVPQAYCVECAVPTWCSVKDAKRNEIRFPVKGLLADSEREAKYILVYDGAEFDTLTTPLKVGVNKLTIKYGLASLRVLDVPSGCLILVNGNEKKSLYNVPVEVGVPTTLWVYVQDQNRVEVYRETVTLEAGNSKTIRVPAPTAEAPTDSVSTQQTVTSIPTPERYVPSASSVTTTLTRRMLIGSGISVVVGGGWFVRNGLSPKKSKYEIAAYKIRDNFPCLADYVKSLCEIPGGPFQMGGDRHEDEKPFHIVTLSSFAMGSTPVTVALWKEYATAKLSGQMPPEPDPSGFDGARKFNIGWKNLDHPVVNVSWDDCRKFCTWATEVSGIAIDLPSEAQWEYACRGGVSGQEYPWGGATDDISVRSFLTSNVWCSDAKLGDRGGTGSINRSTRIWRNHPWGLTDMVGNVWEWCLDWYDPEWYGRPQASGLDVVNRNSAPAQTITFFDGTKKDAASRCVRGGSWFNYNPDYFRCANRSGGIPDYRIINVGFRLSSGSG
jgi:formylglycine-generating enzyme required for sulfatase activity/serine/threonine protein kinase